MKRFVVLLALLLLVPVNALAGQFGPVSPSAKPGQISQEIGYFLSQGDWTADKSGFEEGKVTQSQVYVQAGYGLDENWEAYFRIGGADFDFEGAFSPEAGAADMKDGIQPFVTLGARGVFYRGAHFDLGAFVQGTYFSGYEDSNTGAVGGFALREELEVSDFWEVNVGLALQTEFDGIGVYAGPVLYTSQASLDTKATLLDLDVSESNTSDYEEEGNLGAVAGLSIPVSDFGNIRFEGQYKSQVSGGGAFVYLRLNR